MVLPTSMSTTTMIRPPRRRGGEDGASWASSSPRGIDDTTLRVERIARCPGAGNCECLAASSMDAGGWVPTADSLPLPTTGH